jgi:phosphoesterase RecJ-like protein
MGIVADSRNLFYDEHHQTERALQDLLALFKLGARKKDIIVNLYRRKTLEDCKFTSFLLERMQQEGDILYSRYTKEEKARIANGIGSSKYAMQMMQDIQSIPLVIMGKENEKGIGISFRGRGKYDCNQLALHFGGGGHFNAAGCTLPPAPNVANEMKQFIEKVKKLIAQ